MKLNSKYFNNLRIKPKESNFKRKCEYGGCNKKGEYTWSCDTPPARSMAAIKDGNIHGVVLLLSPDQWLQQKRGKEGNCLGGANKHCKYGLSREPAFS